MAKAFKKSAPAISASAINAYTDCPFRYKEEKLDGKYPYEANIHASRGDALHSRLEAFYKTGIWAEDVIPFDVPLDQGQLDKLKALNVNFKSNTQLYDMASNLFLSRDDYPEEITAARLMYFKHFADYGERADDYFVMKDVHERLRALLIAQGFKIYTEIGVYLDQWGRPAPGPFSKNPVPVTQVRIDMLALRDDIAIVVDWKTGKLNTAYVDGPMRQVTYYAAHVFDKYETIQEVWSLVVHPTPEHNGVLEDRYRRNDPRLKAIIDTAHTLYKNVNAYYTNGADQAFQEKRPGGLCKAWCPVMDCEHNGRR